jgi:hypothetical protein
MHGPRHRPVRSPDSSMRQAMGILVAALGCWRPPDMRWRRIAGSVAETHLHDTLAPVAEAVIQKVCAPMPAVNDDPLFVPSGDRLGGFAIRRL